jgi:hypothetical protein
MTYRRSVPRIKSGDLRRRNIVAMAGFGSPPASDRTGPFTARPFTARPFNSGALPGTGGERLIFSSG